MPDVSVVWFHLAQGLVKHALTIVPWRTLCGVDTSGWVVGDALATLPECRKCARTRRALDAGAVAS